jgi:glycosyltransferase involved in cell wall biosynthesis
VSRFIAPSRFYVEKLQQWGIARTSLHHVPNFIVTERYVPEFSPGTDFVYFGRLSPEKGVATLIRAAASAGCRLRIAGTGPQAEALHALAAELGADVTFLGYLTGRALHDAIRSARAVVLPSEWYENAPMSVLESYALGKPVIGARIGGIPELVLERRTGLTFNSGDAASLTVAMREIADMADHDVTALGRAGRKWVEHEFTDTRYRDRVVEIYRALGVPLREGA